MAATDPTAIEFCITPGGFYAPNHRRDAVLLRSLGFVPDGPAEPETYGCYRPGGDVFCAVRNHLRAMGMTVEFRPPAPLYTSPRGDTIGARVVRRTQLERVIADAAEAQAAASAALREVERDRLFAWTHDDFASYLEGVWGLSPADLPPPPAASWPAWTDEFRAVANGPKPGSASASKTRPKVPVRGQTTAFRAVPFGHWFEFKPGGSAAAVVFFKKSDHAAGQFRSAGTDPHVAATFHPDCPVVYLGAGLCRTPSA